MKRDFVTALQQLQYYSKYDDVLTRELITWKFIYINIPNDLWKQDFDASIKHANVKKMRTELSPSQKQESPILDIQVAMNSWETQAHFHWQKNNDELDQKTKNELKSRTTHKSVNNQVKWYEYEEAHRSHSIPYLEGQPSRKSLYSRSEA